jgi:hypothetical protein
MAGKKLEVEVAELYGLPLGEWTAARDALAKRLRAAGRAADAEAVKGLHKPSLSAWAVSQLFRREGERMAELLAAGRRARAAQGQAAAGKGAEAFREALSAARRQIEELRRKAVALLAEGGRAVGAGIADRIGTDLEALAFSPAAAAEGARGYLDTDLDPPGFEVLSGLRLASGARSGAQVRKPPYTHAAERPSAAPPARELRLLPFKPPPQETKAAAAARRLAEEAAARQRERIERAEAAVGQAAEKASALGAAAERAEQEAAEARRQLAAAERSAAAARRQAEAAEEELARARERLAAARAGRPN